MMLNSKMRQRAKKILESSLFAWTPIQNIALLHTQRRGKQADKIAEFPSGSKVISVVPSGTSAWVHTVRIEVRDGDGSTKLYFMKVSM